MHKETRKLVKGRTPARVAAGLRHAESRLRRGYNGPEMTREITDPQFGLDVETSVRLQSIVGDPDLPLGRRLDAIESRVGALPEIDALHGLRVVLVAHAVVCIWYVFAVCRDDRARQWQFVLPMLEAAGEGTEGVRKNPGGLRRDLGRLLQLTAQPAGSA